MKTRSCTGARAFALAIGLEVSHLGFAQAATHPQPAVPDDVKDHIRKRVEQAGAGGIIVGLVNPGGSAFFWHSVVTPSEAELGPDSVFEIGSISKVFTAMLLADAVSRGDVQLDDPVAKYLPAGTKVPMHGDKPITLEHLATHRSGLPRIPANLMPKAPDNPYADYAADRLYAALADCTLTTDPGSAYAYSNLGAGLLGHVLALKAGKSYDALVRERICAPLGMPHTAATMTDEMTSRLVRGHAGDKPVANWDFDALAGAGAIRSTARDMIAFLSACLGLPDGKPSPLLIKCLEKRCPTGRPGMDIALGWHIDTKHGADIIWHNGGTGGYHSFCGFRANQQLGVVVLTNTTDDIDDIGMHLLAPEAPLASVRTSVAVAPAALDDYVGYFAFAPGVMLHITRRGDALEAQLTGQDAYPIFAEAKDKFFYKVVDAQLTFARDEAGKVAKVVLHQNGMDQTADRLPPDKEPKPRVETQVAAEVLKTYVGKYELAPGIVFDVQFNGEQLTVQLTSQPRFEVYAESETKFFYKVVDAQITFVRDADGKVGSLILHQGGRDQTAKRVE